MLQLMAVQGLSGELCIVTSNTNEIFRLLRWLAGQVDGSHHYLS